MRPAFSVIKMLPAMATVRNNGAEIIALPLP